MGRFGRLKKRDKKRRVLIGIAIFVVGYFFITSVGLSLLTDASLYMGNLLSGRAEELENSNFLDTLTVDSPPEATSSAVLAMTGFAYGYDTLEFFVNDKKQHTLSIKKTEDFTQTVTGLKEGRNELYVVAGGRGKKEKQSKVFTVTYLTKKPDLEVTEPTSGATVHSEDLHIKGKTDSDNEVRVNGQPVVVNPNGTFEYQIRIKEGENKLQVTSQDAAGNTTNLELTVKYEKE